MAKSSSLLWVWYMYQFNKYRPTTEKFLQAKEFLKKAKVKNA